MCRRFQDRDRVAGREQDLFNDVINKRKEKKKQKNYCHLCIKFISAQKDCSQKEKPIELLNLVYINNSEKIFLATVLRNRQFIVLMAHTKAVPNAEI